MNYGKKHCLVKGCTDNHNHHYCKFCKSTDSNHFSSKCPRGPDSYHQNGYTNPQAQKGNYHGQNRDQYHGADNYHHSNGPSYNSNSYEIQNRGPQQAHYQNQSPKKNQGVKRQRGN